MVCPTAYRFAQLLMFATTLAVSWSTCLGAAVAQVAGPAPVPATNRAPPGYRAVHPTAPVNRAPGVPAAAFNATARGASGQGSRVSVAPRVPALPHRGVVIVIPGAARTRSHEPRATRSSAGAVAPWPNSSTGVPRRRWQRQSRIPSLESGAAQDTQLGAEVRGPLARARRAFSAVRYREAIVELRQVLYAQPASSDPRDGQAERRVARLGLGLAYLGLARPQAAEVAFRAAAADAPDVRVAAWLETVYSFLPRPSIFEPRLGAAEGPFLAAVREMLAGDVAAAARLLSAALEADPRDREAARLLSALAAHGGGQVADLASATVSSRSER